MSNNQPLQQCNFCFHSAGPFYSVRILPITPITSLSGTATPPHASIPDTKQIICHHCRYSHCNIEPWTEPDVTSPQNERNLTINWDGNIEPWTGPDDAPSHSPEEPIDQSPTAKPLDTVPPEHRFRVATRGGRAGMRGPRACRRATRTGGALRMGALVPARSAKKPHYEKLRCLPF